MTFYIVLPTDSSVRALLYYVSVPELVGRNVGVVYLIDVLAYM
jgi:hypothetical protein